MDRPSLLVLVLIAIGFGCLDAAFFVFGPHTTGWAGPAAFLVLNLVVDAAVCWLTRYPLAVAVLTVAVAAAFLGSDVLDPGLLVPADPLSLATVPTATPALVANFVPLFDRRRTALVIGALAVLAARPWNPSWAITPAGLLNTIVPALLILYLDARQQLVRSLRDRAERAEREQHLLAERARAEERARLAAEMHDVVTHRLSLIVLHAGALGVSTREATVRDAVEDIRAAGTQALDELRDVVGVLRGDPTGPGATDGDDAAGPDPATLVAESRAAGMAVELRTEGEPSVLSPTVARTAYRIVQEALTNVRKHAPGASVTVELRYTAAGLRIEVTNTAPRGQPDPLLATGGSGAGLAGLRKRVELVGGSVHAGRVAGTGGYRLGAILPAYVPTAESKGT